MEVVIGPLTVTGARFPFCAAGYGILGTFGGKIGLTFLGSSVLVGITTIFLISSEPGLRGSGLAAKVFSGLPSSVDFAGPCIFFFCAGGLGGFPAVGEGGSIGGNFFINLGSKETQSSSTKCRSLNDRLLVRPDVLSAGDTSHELLRSRSKVLIMVLTLMGLL